MELRQLKYFLTLSEELHFKAASAKLGITQPALSHAIKALEDEIGVELFWRGRKRLVQLTPAGIAFAEGARRTLVESQKSLQIAQSAQDGSAGSLTIGHTDDFVTDILPDLIHRFTQAFPGIILDLQQRASYRLPDALNRGELDCIFETMPLPGSTAGCASHILAPTPIVLAVSTRHRFCRRESVSLKEVESEQHFFSPRPRRSSFDLVLEDMLVSANVVIREKIAVYSSTLILEYVRRGFGVALGTLGAFPSMIKGVKCIPIRHEVNTLGRALVWRHDNPNPVLDQFINYTRQT